jgi:hypothetical protein
MAKRIRPLGRPRLVVVVATTLLVAGLAGSAGATNAPGFKTSKPPMLQAVAPRAWVDPIMSVGDDIGSYQFEAIPDGISIRKAQGYGKAEVYVNHETSTVPFPYVAPNPNALPNPVFPTTANSQNDFDNAQLSKLILDTDDAGVLQASMAITSAEGFQRFCSNFLATKANGFSRDLLFTNEEAVDWVKRSGPTFWPATEGAADARQSGVVVALDPKTGERRPIWGMGRLNHENSLAVPGYKKPVVLTGDDTFVNNPSQSQMFSYIANDANAVWNDTGDLWAFVSDDSSRQKYEDFTLNDATSVAGHFIPVPKLIATGRNPNGTDVMSADAEAALGLPAGTFAVPTDGSFSRPPGSPPTGGNIASVDGPQWVLEKWSQMNGVFRFVRLEDMAYDKRQGMSNVVYVVDSGRGTTLAPANGKSTNGRIWKMVLDKNDPTKVLSLSILIEGDDSPVKTIGEIHQPDNIESTKRGLYITEDPGSSQQFSFTDPAQVNDPNRTPARIWQYKLSGGATSVVAVVDQSQDEAAGDVDTTARGSYGAWEASGIVDVSDFFGPGTFLVTVQAHTLFVEIADGPDIDPGVVGADWLNKREGGQLLLLRIPGA